MGTYTKNYKMYKPAKTDYYNVEKDQNANFDILDTELKKTNDSNKDLFEMIQGNSGIKFDKNLIFLNDTGEKKKGNVYLDRLQNGLFECIQTTTSTVNNSSYFKNFSNNELSNRLDNLFTNEEGSFRIGPLTFKYGFMSKIYSDNFVKFSTPFENKVLAVIPILSGSSMNPGDGDFCLQDSFKATGGFKILKSETNAQVRISYIALGY